jgi:hypothetical protein
LTCAALWDHGSTERAARTLLIFTRMTAWVAHGSPAYAGPCRTRRRSRPQWPQWPQRLPRLQDPERYVHTHQWSAVSK